MQINYTKYHRRLHIMSVPSQAAQALSMDHTTNTIWHRIINALYKTFYKISMEVVKTENSQ